MAEHSPPLRPALTDALTDALTVAPLNESSIPDEKVKDSPSSSLEVQKSGNIDDALDEANLGGAINEGDECATLTTATNMTSDLDTDINKITTPTQQPLSSPPTSQPTTKRPRKPKPNTSPFWATLPLLPAPKPPLPTPRPRPPPNTISSLPIPPLSSPSFGLIQETLATSPFALLVATTFLTKTKATAALPVFRQLMNLYPTPEAIAAADPGVIQNMMQPLGLSYVRTKKIQNMARIWVATPPDKGRRYGVRNYPAQGGGSHVQQGGVFGPEDESGGEDAVVDKVEDVKRRGVGCAWEIGHVTTGAYALDSWRIFCRDELLGRAEDWKGGGRGGGFQPEWMRVFPKDKELRACLRWCWMKEGWEWDAENGEREVLREEVRRAVEEGRVGYDERGELVVLGEKRGEGYGGHFQGTI